MILSSFSKGGIKMLIFIMLVIMGSNPFPCIIFTLDKDLNNHGHFIFIRGRKKIEKKNTDDYNHTVVH